MVHATITKGDGSHCNESVPVMANPWHDDGSNQPTISSMSSTSTAPLMILLAAPYRSGTGDSPALMQRNLHAMERVALRIYQAGHIPVIGEWFALPLMREAGSERVGDAIWNEIQYPVANRLLTKCDGVLRLPGESKGADQDVRLARERGLTIYSRIEDIPGCA